MKNLIFILLLVGLFISDSAFGGLFSITNRRYGDITDPTFQAPIDEALNTLETQVNALLPAADSSSYLAGIANSTVIANAGLSADYASDPSLFVAGFHLGGGADLGGQSMSSVMDGTIDPVQIKGFSMGSSIVVGVNVARWWKPLGDRDLKFYLGYSSNNIEQSSFTFNQSSISLAAQAKLFKGVSKAAGSLKWTGVDVTAGLRQTKIGFLVSQSVSQSVDAGTVDIPVPTSVTTAFNGTINFGADVNITTITTEISTGAKVGYIFAPYVGLGIDTNLTGKATSTANLSSDVAVQTTPDLGDVGGTAILDLGSEAKPKTIYMRYFAGMQFDVGIGGLFFQYNNNFDNSALGFSGGLRIYW